MAIAPNNLALLMRLSALGIRPEDLPPLPRPAPSAPIPYAPVPSLGPLSDETTAAFGAQNPEPVPPRFVEPAAPDANFVNTYSGAEPTPPPPLSRGQRIANALMGFGAGVQGRGGEFLEQLQGPQREYQRQVERYEGRRAQGQEIAERRAEREADRANRAAEAQYERDYNLYLKKLGIRQNEADARTRQAFDILKIREAERIADERQAVKDKAQQERDARLIARDFGKLGAEPKVALELGRYYATLTDKLSPEAAKFESAQARLADIRARRAAAGGTGGVASGNAASLERQFNALKARFLRAELGTPQAPRGDRALMERIAGQFTAVMGKLEKLGYEVGYDASGIYPYIKPPQGRQQQAAAKTITRAEMAALGVTDAEVKAEGYTIVP